MRINRLIFVVFLASLAAGPATQPATRPVKPFASVREIFARVPHAECPSKWGGQTTHLEEWLGRNAVGKPAQFRVVLVGYVNADNPKESGVVLRVADGSSFAFDGGVYLLRFEPVTMPQSLHDKVFRLKPGTAIFVRGTIKSIVYSQATPRSRGMVRIELAGASI